MRAPADELLAGLFPPGVLHASGVPGELAGETHPEEAALLPRAAARRRAEFLAGRLLARALLERLGQPPRPILRGPSGEPLWPEGIAGSISHARGLCAAVLCRRGALESLGLDVERAEPLGAELVRLVATEREAAALGDLFAAKRVFGAKEAFYKAQHPISGAFLGFREVELDWEGERFLPRILDAEKRARLEGFHFEGRTRTGPAWIVSGAWSRAAGR